LVSGVTLDEAQKNVYSKERVKRMALKKFGANSVLKESIASPVDAL